ncbi:MAG: YegS/Rv2252/BmrU family lipid kinase [Sedimentibacter sp.]|uniref:diacylglycerol/lipid kinase family protein n=1 Tax=Sedimentibacter sp. TaxID=1960295 RepID=UPI0031597C0C
MRHIFIINPVAGKGKTQPLIEKDIHETLKHENADYEIYFTKARGDARVFVQERCGDMIPTVFYACGGDGTLHEVVNAALNFEHARVGVIPCGSGNDFVKNFENMHLFQNIGSQIRGNDVELDLVKAGREYAVSVCNVGFDADAAFNMHKFKKIPFISGSGCYILSVLYCLMKKLGKNLSIEADGEHFEGTYLMGVAANGHSYGGGYKCAPEAFINDGIIDMCLVRKLSRLKILSLIGSYKSGTHLENEKLKSYITYKKCRNVTVKSGEPINLCIDGENYVSGDISFKAVPGILRFNLPEGVKVQGSETVKAI